MKNLEKRQMIILKKLILYGSLCFYDNSNGTFFVLVGSFYGSFSIFLRAVLSSDDCLSITRTANVLENLYLLFLIIVVVLSTTLNVDSAETGFRVSSIIMGLFTLLMIGWSIVYALENTIASISVIFFSILCIFFYSPINNECSSSKNLRFLERSCI